MEESTSMDYCGTRERSSSHSVVKIANSIDDGFEFKRSQSLNTPTSGMHDVIFQTSQNYNQPNTILDTRIEKDNFLISDASNDTPQNAEIHESRSQTRDSSIEPNHLFVDKIQTNTKTESSLDLINSIPSLSAPPEHTHNIWKSDDTQEIRVHASFDTKDQKFVEKQEKPIDLALQKRLLEMQERNLQGFNLSQRSERKDTVGNRIQQSPTLHPSETKSPNVNIAINNSTISSINGCGLAGLHSAGGDILDILEDGSLPWMEITPSQRISPTTHISEECVITNAIIVDRDKKENAFGFSDDLMS